MEILSFFRFLLPLKTKFARRRLQPSTSGDAVAATDKLSTWEVRTSRRIQFRIRWNYPESQEATRRGAATVLVTGDSKGWIEWTSAFDIQSRATRLQSRLGTNLSLDSRHQATRQRLVVWFGAVFMENQAKINPWRRRQLPKWSWVE